MLIEGIVRKTILQGRRQLDLIIGVDGKKALVEGSVIERREAKAVFGLRPIFTVLALRPRLNVTGNQ